MPEPTSIGPAILLGGGAVGSGLAIAVAAVEANPEVALAMTPDVGASIVGLLCAVVVFALKTYVPSEKDVKQEFATVKAQHEVLLVRQKESAEAAKAVQEELKQHRLSLAEWMGDVNRNLSHINNKIDALESVSRYSRVQLESRSEERGTL